MSGPRQIGKTTFMRSRLKELKDDFLYFNWDDPYVRREYIQNPHFLKAYLAKSKNKLPLVVFDEIHKHKNWRNILKGLYDTHFEETQIVVTGSAMLAYFRCSVDSLVGRYFSYKMFPLGVSEAAGNFDFMFKDDAFLAQPQKYKLLNIIQNMPQETFKSAFKRLLSYGGFPEPFIRHKESFLIKWKRDYKPLLIREELRDLSRIQDIKGIEQLVLVLPEKVGSPLSINSLKNDESN